MLKDWKILDATSERNEYIYTKDGKDHISLVPVSIPGEKGMETHWKALHMENGNKHIGTGRSRGMAIANAVDALEGDNVKKAMTPSQQPEAPEPHEQMEQHLGHRGALKYLKANYDTANELGIHKDMEVHTALARVATKTGKHPKDLLNNMMTAHPDIVDRFKDFGFDTMKSEAAVKKAEPKKIARWESKSGKHWVELHSHGDGSYSYKSPGAGGTSYHKTDDEAVQAVQQKVDSGLFQPDANKKPMVKKSEDTMNNAKELVKKAILKKVRAWLMKATQTLSTAVNSGVDKAASELGKVVSPEHIDFDAEIKKSEPTALDTWEPNPFVATSEKK